MNNKRPQYINSPSYKKSESSFGYKLTMLALAFVIWMAVIVAWGLGA